MSKFPVINDSVLSDDFTPDPFLRLVQAGPVVVRRVVITKCTCCLYSAGRNDFDAGNIHYKGQWKGCALKLSTYWAKIALAIFMIFWMDPTADYGWIFAGEYTRRRRPPARPRLTLLLSFQSHDNVNTQ
jgi:hypothetical protein